MMDYSNLAEKLDEVSKCLRETYLLDSIAIVAVAMDQDQNAHRITSLSGNYYSNIGAMQELLDNKDVVDE